MLLLPKIDIATSWTAGGASSMTLFPRAIRGEEAGAKNLASRSAIPMKMPAATIPEIAAAKNLRS
ncbi:hypothetical protein GCM10011401_26420 [Nesterenkonia cremea]|uniref:Uncharacterized protein n=1 Tax=Nesterenkonia cremea TaxID=1882340 RepID=A0A917AV69_9MICC|nr:hypothetical protein GCM10011401_26420 [Nesterenkonia cremea]